MLNQPRVTINTVSRNCKLRDWRLNHQRGPPIKDAILIAARIAGVSFSPYSREISKGTRRTAASRIWRAPMLWRVGPNFMMNAGFTEKSGRFLKWKFRPVHVFHFFLDCFLGDFFGSGRAQTVTLRIAISSEFFLFKFFIEPKW